MFSKPVDLSARPTQVDVDYFQNRISKLEKFCNGPGFKQIDLDEQILFARELSLHRQLLLTVSVHATLSDPIEHSDLCNRLTINQPQM